jgi:uncharacterized protein YggE
LRGAALRHERALMEVVMLARWTGKFALQAAPRRLLTGAAMAALAIFVAPFAQAQQPAAQPEARVIVIGEGSVRVAPDYAQVGGGVITKGKTVKEATDANSKVMAAITSALLNAGIAQADIQTAQFSIQPVYAPPQPQSEPKLAGYSVSNQVTVTVRPLGKVSDILDRMVDAGVTDIGNVSFLHSDPAKALDQAREAAVADARRKAELYARTLGFTLGRVAWVTEDAGMMPPVAVAKFRAQAVMAAPVPIAAGEDTLRVQITVGFDIAN